MIKPEKIIVAFIHICILTYCSALILFSASVIAAEKLKNTIIVSYDNWPPFTDEADPNLGICFSIINAVFKSTDYEVQPRNIPFKRADLYLRTGTKVDASPYYWHNEERAGFLYFSDPLLYNSVHFFVRSDSQITFNHLEDLKGFNIGVIRGYHNGDAFDSASYLKKYVCNDSKQAILMLKIGRLDMAVIDKVVAQTITHKLDIKDRLKALPKPLFLAGLHFVVSKNNPQAQNIIKVFNAGLKKLQENGEYQKIIASYGISNNIEADSATSRMK